MKIVTVCRSGGEYRWDHVERLQEQCAEFAHGVEFLCLSDDGRGDPLHHDWPAWWSKMEVFKIKGPCLYMDLDTTIVGNLEPLIREARGREFITLRDFNFPQRNVQSSLMAWSGDMRRLYELFAADPKAHMAANQTSRWWGDQGFIERNAEPEYWQDVSPGSAVSWKKDCAAGVPDGARVVVFHGQPRPWDHGIA